MLDLDSCVPNRELPINPFLTMIPVLIPSSGFCFQRFDVADSPSQASLGEGGQFYLGQVQPGTMLRGMMKFNLLPDTTSIIRLKRLVQGRDVVRIQVVADKNDLSRVWEVLIYKLFDFLRPVRLAAMCTDCHPSPAFMRSREHEAAAGAVSDVFMVNSLRMVVGRQVDCLSRIVVKFNGLLIHADQRPQRISRAGIHFKHILHMGHERGVLFRRDAPHFPQVRLIPVFFRMRPTCIGDMDGTICSSTTRSDSSRNVHLPRPSGGALHVVAMIFASTSPVHLAGTGGVSRFFRVMVDLSPSVAYLVRTFCTVVGDVLKAVAASMTVIGFFPFLSTARRMLACNIVRADVSPDFTSLVRRLRSAVERLTSYFCIGITVTC